jgi:hypothetical protein
MPRTKILGSLYRGFTGGGGYTIPLVTMDVSPEVATFHILGISAKELAAIRRADVKQVVMVRGHTLKPMYVFMLEEGHYSNLGFLSTRARLAFDQNGWPTSDKVLHYNRDFRRWKRP